jgi:hypothetical protein
MRMPGGARARLERHVRAADTRRFRSLKKRVDADRAGKILGRSFARRLRSAAFDEITITSQLACFTSYSSRNGMVRRIARNGFKLRRIFSTLSTRVTVGDLRLFQREPNALRARVTANRKRPPIRRPASDPGSRG